MKRRRWLRALLPLVLLGAALFVLHSRAGALNPRAIWHQLRALPPSRVLGASALTALNYLQLTLYDAIGLAHLGKRLSRARILLVSFVATAFGHNIGPAIASGGSVRYRFYSKWGLTLREVAEIVGVGVVTFSVGFFVLGGVALVSLPSDAATALVAPGLLRAVGAVMLVLAAGYVVHGLRSRAPIRLWKWEVRVPAPRLILLQILTAAGDWLFMAAVLMLLLPPSSLAYVALLRVVLVAQVAGMLSQVPGGLGVFESLMLAALTPELPAASVLGSLIVYRALYYFAPFTLATTLLAGSELLERRARARQRSVPAPAEPAPPLRRTVPPVHRDRPSSA